MRIILGLLFIVITCFQLNAQGQQKLIRITGHVTTAEDTSAIAYAHVLNLTYPSGTFCDQAGNFSLVCHYGDTLKFSAVGYENDYFATRSLDFTKTEHFVRIRLAISFYMLPSVTILPYSSVAGLKRAFQATTLSDKDLQNIALRKKMKIKPDEVGGIPSYGISLSGIVTGIYNLFSKEAKTRKKYGKVLHGENVNTFIERRYNAQVVARIIGKDDHKLINDFMKQCRFSTDFFFVASDYDLYLAIKQNWLNYAKVHNIK
jgi:hypothetical protein